MLLGGMWEEAGDVLASCGEPKPSRLAAGAYATAGLFDKACGALRSGTDVTGETGRLEARVFLLGGCLPEASAALRRYAAWFEEHGRSKDPTTFPVASHVRAIGCVADAIEAHAGSNEALQRLSASKEEECRLCRAAFLKGKERRDALSFLNEASENEKRTLQRHPMLSDVLTAAAGGEPSLQDLPSIPTASALLLGVPPWDARAHALEVELLDTLAAEPTPSQHRRSLRIVLAMRAAIFEAMAGNREQAIRLLDVADADTRAMSDAIDSESVERLRVRAQLTTIRVLANILSGDTDRARGAIDAWELEPGSFLGEVAPLGDDSSPARLEVVRRQVVPLLVDARALVAIAQGAKFSPEADGFALAVSSSMCWSSPEGFGADLVEPLRKVTGEGVAKVLDACSQPAFMMLVASRMHTEREELGRRLQIDRRRDLRLDWTGSDSADLFTEALLTSTMFARTAAMLELPEIESRNRTFAARYQAALSQHAIAVPWAAMSGL
jgi:hypothetical protein